MSTVSSTRIPQHHLPASTEMSTPSKTAVSPVSIPRFVYRVHRTAPRTKLPSSTSSAYHSGLAHLNQQTNISSPFISVYRSQDHAKEVARYFAWLYEEDTLVVTIDTNHLSRGPVFWAAYLLKGQELTHEQKWLHGGEYLLMYWISREAIRNETLVRKETRSYGAIGGPEGPSTVTSTGSNGSPPSHTAISQTPLPAKWTEEEDKLLIKLRKERKLWDEIVKHLPGKSLFSCQARYDLVESVWWKLLPLGKHEMIARVNAPVFHLHLSASVPGQPSPPPLVPNQIPQTHGITPTNAPSQYLMLNSHRLHNSSTSNSSNNRPHPHSDRGWMFEEYMRGKRTQSQVANDPLAPVRRGGRQTPVPSINLS